VLSTASIEPGIVPATRVTSNASGEFKVVIA
jgi:hypothetical protein